MTLGEAVNQRSCSKIFLPYIFLPETHPEKVQEDEKDVTRALLKLVVTISGLSEVVDAFLISELVNDFDDSFF